MTKSVHVHHIGKQRGVDDPSCVTGHEKIGIMCNQNMTTLLDFQLKK